ncbi:MAG: tetratricopeptide repeat protein, partial [Armatimonadota bacterium]|nr:tetratricopeptide repeat protein [Armatimonadota bacterium]
MSKKKHSKSARPLPPRLQAGLNEVESLVTRARWGEARELLEALDHSYPRRPEVLTLLANVCSEQNDAWRYQQACEQLLRLAPDDPELHLALANAYILNTYPVLGLQTLRRFLERWPEHARADEAREILSGLEATATNMVDHLGFSGEDAWELATLHEKMGILLEQGQFREARQAAQQLLERRPDFTPTLNNLSQIMWLEGGADGAIATATRVLDIDPDNVHALSNLARYCYLSGRAEEAWQWAERLKASPATGPELWLKKAEALSYMGDDEGVLEIFQHAVPETGLQPLEVDPTLPHLAAVAALRLGREDEARRYWKQTLSIAPGWQLAQENLDDLKRPVGERHAPWPFALPNWIPQRAIDDLLTSMEATGHSEEAAMRATRVYLRRHPEVAQRVPFLLDRGDPMGREFALRLALMAQTPEMLEALRDFALGQRGPDALRHQAAQGVAEAGLLPSGPTRLWYDGEWRELILMGFELHDEPIIRHRRRVQELLAQAIEALHQDRADEAEELFQQALEIEPDAPDILNNLAVTYG